MVLARKGGLVTVRCRTSYFRTDFHQIDVSFLYSRCHRLTFLHKLNCMLKGYLLIAINDIEFTEDAPTFEKTSLLHSHRDILQAYHLPYTSAEVRNLQQ